MNKEKYNMLGTKNGTNMSLKHISMESNTIIANIPSWKYKMNKEKNS